MAAGSEVIALPQGGGALRGIEESFAPDLHTGAGNFSIPLALPPGRNGFGPSFELVYSTANGNGPFGLGWTLSIPTIARKTAKGVPRYDDESDVFALPGAEDLVRVSSSDGRRIYRPRSEELFARIEQVREQGRNFWRVSTTDGLVHLYGARSDGGRADPFAHPAALLRASDDTQRIFAWQLSESSDPFGNRVEYDYVADEPADPGLRVGDAARGHAFRQRLLERIRYVDYDDSGATRFLVSVSFEHEDRPDRFSDYRPGFELRRTRRCKRIVIRTHADAALGQPVRHYELVYLDELEDRPGGRDVLPPTGVSLLSRVRIFGYEDNAAGVEGASREEMAPLDFGYTRFQPRLRRFEQVGGPMLPPGSLSSPDYELVDLNGDGLPDVLELNGAARYWANTGGRFERPRQLRAVPGGIGLADRGVELLDADGDGRADLLVQAAGGYYPLRLDGETDQRSLRRYERLPSVDLDDPELRLVDLDGDGLTDFVRAGSRIECFFNDARPKEAWRQERRVPRRSLEDFPNVGFSDPAVRWADMTGDGLQDLVVTRSGSVEYWPNVGHGSWGRRIQMEDAPRLPAGHDPRRLLLGDVDGDGLADLVWVDQGSVSVWLNRSGNGWSEPIVIEGTPHPSDLDVIRLTDLRGTGVAGVLWSRRLGAPPRESLFFLDLCGAEKPYLLNAMDNNIGAITEVEYRPSTHFYLADAARPATRWRSPLPFPVQVVSRMTTRDRISGSEHTSLYRYHHGYWDGRAREFRGFGRVDQLDSELGGAAQIGAPPLEHRTWFHLGPVDLERGGWRESDFSHEYWSGDDPLLQRPSGTAALLRGLSPAQRRDAVRTLRGRVMRTEVYALDGSPSQRRPFHVSETLYGVSAVIEGPNEPALSERASDVADVEFEPVFFAHARATRTTRWERGDDPLTTITFADGHDGYGRPRDELTLALPRRSARRSRIAVAFAGEIEPDERRVLATLTRRAWARPDPSSAPRLYVHDRATHELTFELRAPPEVNETQPQELRTVLRDQLASALDIRDRFATALTGWHVGSPLPTAVKLLGHVRNRYDGQPFEGRTDGLLGPAAALSRVEELVFTDAELDEGLGQRRPAYLGGGSSLPPGAPAGFGSSLGYRQRPATADAYCAGWYADRKRERHDALGNIVAAQDPRGRQTDIVLDRFGFLPERVSDSAGLTTVAVNDYRALQPRRVIDPNGNATVYRYSPSGLLRKLWHEGRAGEGGSESRPDTLHEYGLRAFEATRDRASPQPIFVHTTRRVEHASVDPQAQTVELREYTDGFGRIIQKRAEARALRVTDLGLPLDPAVAPTPATVATQPGAVSVSGWRIHDHKGRVVARYEPFYATGWDFQPREEAAGRPRVEVEYDPLDREVRTRRPDGAEERDVYGVPSDLETPDEFVPSPWEAYSYDSNDLDGFRSGGYLSRCTRRAPSTHHATPTSRTLDGLGRTLCTVERNGPDPERDWFASCREHDVRGNVIRFTDPLGRPAFTHAYDLKGRPLRRDSIDAGLSTSVHDAVDEVVELQDGNGAVTLREQDGLGRLLRVWARDGAVGRVTLREQLTYGDAADPNQPVATREANRRLNRLGRVATYRDGAGLLEFAAYDFKGNIIEKRRRPISDAALGQGWTADWNAPNTDTALEGGFAITTRYDGLNRPAEVLYPREARPRPGAQASVRARLVISYDAAGARRRVELDGAPFVEEAFYDARGRPLLAAYGNGLMSRYAYDPTSLALGRLRTERRAPGGGYVGQGPPLQDLAYAYDPAGNLVTTDERAPGCGIRASAAGADRLERRFDFDPLYRLTSATGRACRGSGAPGALGCGSYAPPYSAGGPVPNQANAPDLTEAYTETYAYDPLGNLLSLRYSAQSGSSNRTFGFGGLPPARWSEAASNLTTSMQAGSSHHQLGYDLAGNLARQNGTISHEWDHAGRRVGYRVQQGAQPSVQARYQYAADGARIRKWVRRGNARPDTSVYLEGLFELRRWREGGVAKRANYLHVMGADDDRVAVVRHGDASNADAGPPTQYHLSAHGQTSHLVVDAAGTWVNREEYSPYGETSFGGFARKRFRFGGRERDEESGLSEHSHRYYSAGFCRWISPDPHGPVDGPSLYVFGRANPMRFSDPMGTNGVVVPGAPFNPVTPQPPPQPIPPPQVPTLDRFTEALRWTRVGAGGGVAQAGSGLGVAGAAGIGAIAAAFVLPFMVFMKQGERHKQLAAELNRKREMEKQAPPGQRGPPILDPLSGSASPRTDPVDTANAGALDLPGKKPHHFVEFPPSEIKGEMWAAGKAGTKPKTTSVKKVTSERSYIYILHIFGDWGDELKVGRTNNPVRRMEEHLEDFGEALHQMEIYDASATPNALAGETLLIGALGARAINIRQNTLSELKGGGAYKDLIETPHFRFIGIFRNPSYNICQY